MASLPVVDNAFEWQQAPWGQALVCRPLSKVARHLFTTRHLQLTGADGWSALAASLGVAPGRIVRLHQVHGASVVVVKAAAAASPPVEADAAVGDDPSVSLAVRVADCAPILLADRVTGAVGAVHAGWKGTAARVATAAVAVMQEAFGTSPADLVVAIGPTIGSCCYEVGSELVDVFAERGHERHLIDRWFLARPPRRGESARPPLRLDITGSNRDQLVLAGVPEQQIHVAGLCTAMHLDLLTSFRAEQAQAGRMAAVIRPASPPT